MSLKRPLSRFYLEFSGFLTKQILRTKIQEFLAYAAAFGALALALRKLPCLYIVHKKQKNLPRAMAQVNAYYFRQKK